MGFFLTYKLSTGKIVSYGLLVFISKWMVFSKAMPEAFCVTFFYGSRESDKEPRLFIGRVSNEQLLAKQLCVVFIGTREHL